MITRHWCRLRTHGARFCAGMSLACSAAVTAPAAASPLFELTGGSFGTGGFSARTTGASASSTYFNPALLPRARQGLELGVMMVNDAISIDVEGKNPANDVPESAVGRFGQAFPSVPTRWLQQGCDPAQGGNCASHVPAAPRQGQGSSGNVRLYQAIGFISHLIPRRLSVGLYALIPYGGSPKRTRSSWTNASNSTRIACTRKCTVTASRPCRSRLV